MPRKLKTPKGRIGQLTDDQEWELIFGPGNSSSFENDFLRRAAWYRHGDKLMADFDYLPGGRPWAWWKYSAPEPRRVVGKEKLRPPGGYPPSPHMEAMARTARVKCKCGEWHTGEYCVFESERDYLTRLDLLSEDEKAKLAAMVATWGK